jgi:hypothetical protein
LIFTTPIGLDGKNFLVKQSFNKALEFFELFKDFRFVLKKIDPCKLTKIINKGNIIFIPSNRIISWISYIRKD